MAFCLILSYGMRQCFFTCEYSEM